MPKLDRSHLPIIDQLLTEMNIKEDFADLYLSDRTLFHAFGMADSTVAFYQSESEPAWFCLVSGGQNVHVVLDEVIDYNEASGRLKFYVRGEIRLSNKTSERYSFIDEYRVPSNGMCFYKHHGAVFFGGKLIPEEVTIRCYFLKQEYRGILPLGGNI